MDGGKINSSLMALKETCSRVDGGIAEDSFRLLWLGLGACFRFLRFTWPAGERPRRR